MTLIVSALWKDATTGEFRTFTDGEDGHYMGGVERARSELWGSEAVKRRGARFLPQLAETNLWVAPEELTAFVEEVRALLADVDGLRSELCRGPDCSLPHYLGNFLQVAEYAAMRDGGVCIE